jgi:hypothetical protein
MQKRLFAALFATLVLFAQVAQADNVTGKNASSATVYFKSTGIGTNIDPYVRADAITNSSGTNTAAVDSVGADGGSNTSSRLAVNSWPHGYNGTTWDRIRAGLTGTTSTPTGYLNTLPFGRYNATPPTLTDGQWTSLQFDSSGALKVNPGTVAVTGTFWQATQPVSGTITANAGTGPWPVTDNGGSLTVDGTVAAAQSGTWNVGTVSTISNVVHVDDNSSTLSIDDGGGSITVDGTVTANLAAGTNAIGKLAANSGVDIGDVDVTSVITGTGATNLGKAEDVAHTTGDTGVMMLGVRNDGGSALAGTDGDYIPLSTDSSGALRVTGGGGGTEYTEGDTDSTITGGAILWEDTSDTLRPVSAAKPLPVNVVSGGTSGTEYTEDAAAASDPAGPMSMAVRADSLAAVTTTDGDNIALRATNKGELYVKQTDVVPVTDNGGSLTVDGAVTASGNVAHDAADSGNPVKIGAVARTSDPTAVASGDRVNLIADKIGRLVIAPNAIPENATSGATSDITNTTSTSVIAAQGAGIKTYITSILVMNSHATVGTWVNITDGSGGTVLATGYAAPAGGGWTLYPTPGIATTANTAVHAVCVTTGANVRVTVAGFKGP